MKNQRWKISCKYFTVLGLMYNTVKFGYTLSLNLNLKSGNRSVKCITVHFEVPLATKDELKTCFKKSNVIGPHQPYQLIQFSGESNPVRGPDSKSRGSRLGCKNPLVLPGVDHPPPPPHTPRAVKYSTAIIH
jgi:hypothetical protein